MFDPIELAQSAPDGAAFERAVLDTLAALVGYDVAFFATLGTSPTTVGPIDPERLERAFACRDYEHELWPIKRAAIAARGVAVDTAVLGEAEVRRRAYHRDFAAPVNGRHSLMAYLVLRGRPLGAIMLGRAGSSFSERDLDRIADALPSITLGRASYRAPVVLPALPDAPSAPALQRAVAWARGERVLARVDRPGRDRLIVRDRGGFREMVAASPTAELVWSRAALGDPRRSGWFYIDLFHLAAARAAARTRALFIGCGGAVAVRQFAEVYPGIAIDLVEIDPAVLALAEDWYGLASIPQLTVHADDGFTFVARAPAHRWDVIVVDAYDASAFPERLGSRDFFRAARRVLRPGGAIAFNAIGSLAGTSGVQHVERHARHELEAVRLVPVLDPDESFSPSALRNVVVLASAPRG